eukprot:580266-Pleurochrysis_carterae.AAC.1
MPEYCTRAAVQSRLIRIASTEPPARQPQKRRAFDQEHRVCKGWDVASGSISCAKLRRKRPSSWFKHVRACHAWKWKVNEDDQLDDDESEELRLEQNNQLRYQG